MDCSLDHIRCCGRGNKIQRLINIREAASKESFIGARGPLVEESPIKTLDALDSHVPTSMNNRYVE